LKNFKKYVGKKFRLRRKELALGSQGELAKTLHIDTARISDWERGVHLPEGTNREALLKALDADESLIDIPDDFPDPAGQKLSDLSVSEFRKELGASRKPLTADEKALLRLFEEAGPDLSKPIIDSIKNMISLKSAAPSKKRK
jgi:transcriptional regulator with XRE-family HTH domain